MEATTPDSKTRMERTNLSISGMSCPSCADKIAKKVRGLSGVSGVTVSLAAGAAEVEYDPDKVGVASVAEAIQGLGYGVGEISEDDLSSLRKGSPVVADKDRLGRFRTSLIWPLVMGVGGLVLLGLFYIGIVGGTSRDLGHAFELLGEDAPLVTAIAVGFGVQIGLWGYLRKSLRASKVGRSSNAVAASGTGTSTVSMIACCAHHVADFLPLMGLTSAGMAISEYRIPLMSLGLIGNGVGILLMLRLIWRVRRGQLPLRRERVSKADLGPKPPLDRRHQPIP